ncbi:hypothetical protein [Mesorhizobium sp. L2C066B000]|uniref:DUF6894 family protein n=2 Tax=unclassified Mesorhizobium TaxID=325217 RepID=UPI0004CF521E|nr:hypothetical protein [Mesorhizobium sp. L2C066B000]
MNIVRHRQESVMQVVRTEVVNARAPDGQSVRRVIFCGEGGDCVTVDMANVGIQAEDDVLARAKAILVQTATFDLAANEYDASSNGNFDQVEITSASDGAGDVYVFEYRDGGTSRRIPPSRMASLEAARSEAIRCAIDLLADLQPGTDALSGWLVRVSNENGELLYTVDVAEADAARQAGQ